MLAQDKINDLRQFDLFKELDCQTLEQIVPYFTKRLYKRNEVVYATNTEARYFLFVLTGKVKIFRLSELGNEQIIRMIAPMEFTGELALFEGIRKAHAVAMVKSEIYLIENQQFKQLLVDYPQLSLKMIKPCLSGYTLQNSNPCCYLLVPQKTGYSISFVRKPSW